MALLACCCLFPCLAFAQLTPRLIKIQPIQPAADSNFVERVTAPGAMWAAVNEPARMLAVGHGLVAPYQLSLFVLDETGHVVTSAPPVTIKLPKPASLAGYTNVVAAMATHPTQPILYVLQDLHTPTPPPPVGDPQTNPVFKEFERLFVYRLDPTNTHLVATLRGERFLYGQVTAGYFAGTNLGIDAVNRRLYLPSLRDPSVTNAVRAAVGFIELDDEGLPVKRDGEIVPPEVQGHSSSSPVGMGWAPQSRDVVVYGWYGGMATWDMKNRRAPITAKWCGMDWGGMITAHPNLPIVYRTTSHSGRIYAYELVDGFPSLFPQEINMAYSYSPQVILKRSQLAVGAANVVYLIRLEKDGRLTGEVTSVAVADFDRTAFCYSPAFDRLYVAAGKVAP